MTRTINLTDLAAKRTEDIEEQIVTQASRAAAVIQGIAQDDSVKPLVTLNLLMQLGDVLEAFDIEGASTAGQEQALRGQPLALTAGSSSDDSNANNANQALLRELLAVAEEVNIDPATLIKWCKRLFGPLAGLQPNELKGRSVAMNMIAEGVIKVKDDGTPEVAEQFEQLQKQYEQFQPFQAAARSLEQVKDANEKRKRLNGIAKVADGTTQVENDGTPVSPAPAPTPAVPADVKAKADMFDDVKAHTRKVSGMTFFGHDHWELDFQGVKKGTFVALTS